MTGLALNRKLWDEAIVEFTKLYGQNPQTIKDWSRVTYIYSSFGGTFADESTIIPQEIKENIMKEGVFDTVKSELIKLFKNPVILGIALYFLNNLYQKNKQSAKDA
jgi:hypothetical protein